MQVRDDEGVAIHIGPEPSVSSREACGRSVGRGTHRPAIEPRNEFCSRCRRVSDRGRQHVRVRKREHPDEPAWSKTLACADALCAGTGRFHELASGGRTILARRWLQRDQLMPD